MTTLKTSNPPARGSADSQPIGPGSESVPDPGPPGRGMSIGEARELALKLATAGFHIFPIGLSWNIEKGSVDKSPLSAAGFTHGFHDATNDPDIAKRMFNTVRIPPLTHPGVGIRPGPSGYIVLDVDIKNGGTGPDDLKRLDFELGELPQSTRVDTASGGWHFWLKRPADGGEIGNADLAPGIEVRCDSGYVVAPGVRSPWGAWTWDETTPRFVDTATIPDSWAGKLNGHRPDGTREPIPERLTVGSRHRNLLRVAGAMRRQGAGYDEILAAVTTMNETRCDPPKPAAEVEALARDVTGRYPPEPDADVLLADPPAFRVVTVEAFADKHEEGADPLLGDTDDALIPEGGEVLVYGDGGAGKTTLTVDAVCHLSAGDNWLGITVKRPLTVMLIENEGPRPLFRRKLDRKLETWTGSPIGNRLHILEDPWARFTLADETHRAQLAATINGLELDVVVIGPITVAGMDEAGTIQDTRAFQALLTDVRDRAGRRVTFILIHHENKGGKVSGAWEGTGDTLLHILGMGHGKTRMHIQKARWAPTYHATTLNLLWTQGESYEVEEKEEFDQETIARLIYEYVKANPGTGWTKVEEATHGIARQRRRDIRDQLLKGRQIVNVVTNEGVETAIDEIPERKPARLFPADDPTILHLRPDHGAGAAQTAPPGGERDDAQLRPAPRLKEAQGVGAPGHPEKSA